MIVNKVDISGLEDRFSDVPGKMVLLSPDSIVMASNIREWVFRSMNPLDSWQQQLLVDGRQFGESDRDIAVCLENRLAGGDR